MSLSDTFINNVHNYKYIGVKLDSKLDFKNHIIKLNKKLIIIYNSIFQLYLNYGNILWGNKFSNNTINTTTIQKKP